MFTVQHFHFFFFLKSSFSAFAWKKIIREKGMRLQEQRWSEGSTEAVNLICLFCEEFSLRCWDGAESWSLIIQCAYNEWLLEKRLPVKNPSSGTPEGNEGAWWFNSHTCRTTQRSCDCADSVCSWTMLSQGWLNLKAVTARGPAAPMVWCIGIKSCGWSLKTAGTVHVRWVLDSAFPLRD